MWKCTKGSDQDHPQGEKKKKCKKPKWVSEYTLQVTEKRREDKAKGKGKDISMWIVLQRRGRRNKKADFSEECKKKKKKKKGK